MDNEILEVELVEKEIISIEFSTIDSLPARVDIATLGDITNVTIDSILNLQVLRYNESTGYWENKNITELITDFTKYEEPTKITSKRFQTSYDFISGTLEVWLNGIKEKEITIIDTNTFEFKIDTITNDVIEVRYIRQP